MIQSILNVIGRLIQTTDTMYPFTDFPTVSLLKMIVGLIILTCIFVVFTGREDKEE